MARSFSLGIFNCYYNKKEGACQQDIAFARQRVKVRLGEGERFSKKHLFHVKQKRKKEEKGGKRRKKAEKGGKRRKKAENSLCERQKHKNSPIFR